MGNYALYLASLLTFIAALLHFACIFWGAAGFRFLGAGESLVKKAEVGHWYPKFTAISVGLVLTICSILVFLAARGTLFTFTQPILIIVAAVLLLRACLFPLLKSRFVGNSDLFWYISSFFCLVLGSLYVIGLLLR